MAGSSSGRRARDAGPGRGRPAGDARASPRRVDVGRFHPSISLSLALDERLRIDAIDGVTPLDVQQLERTGRGRLERVTRLTARDRGDDVVGSLPAARAALSASLCASYRDSNSWRWFT